MAMDLKMEATFALFAALIVMFTAMINPIFSMVISVSVLVLFSLYKFKQK